MYFAQMAELIEMAFWGPTLVGLGNHELDGGQDRMNPFATARGDKSAMGPFAKVLWTLVNVLVVLLIMSHVEYF